MIPSTRYTLTPEEGNWSTAIFHSTREKQPALFSLAMSHSGICGVSMLHEHNLINMLANKELVKE